MTSAKTVAMIACGTGTSSLAEAAMPAMSAPTLIVFAMPSRTAHAMTKARPYRLRMIAARPSPVTMPMRALASCTAVISGSVKDRVHSIPYPNCAPAWA